MCIKFDTPAKVPDVMIPVVLLFSFFYQRCPFQRGLNSWFKPSLTKISNNQLSGVTGGKVSRSFTGGWSTIDARWQTHKQQE